LFTEDAEDMLVLDKLVGLYTMIGDWNGLVATLERKVSHSLDVGERCELLRRIASVYEELLGDVDTAIGVYIRATQEDDMDALSFEALDRLYTSRAASAPLVEVWRRSCSTSCGIQRKRSRRIVPFLTTIRTTRWQLVSWLRCLKAMPCGQS
jgi:hypothetical protein